MNIPLCVCGPFSSKSGMQPRVLCRAALALAVVAAAMLVSVLASPYTLRFSTERPPSAWFKGGLHASSPQECLAHTSESTCKQDEGCQPTYGSNGIFDACVSFCDVATTRDSCIGTLTTGPYGCIWIENDSGSGGTCAYDSAKPVPVLHGHGNLGPFYGCTSYAGADEGTCARTSGSGGAACHTSIRLLQAGSVVACAALLSAVGMLIAASLMSPENTKMARVVSVCIAVLVVGIISGIASAASLYHLRTETCGNDAFGAKTSVSKRGTISYTGALLIAANVLAAASLSVIIAVHMRQ